MSIYVFATLDTKGPEAEFIRRRLAESTDVVLVDTGCLGEATVSPDVTREAFFDLAGVSLEQLQKRGDRGEAVAAAAEAAAILARNAFDAGKLDAVLALGGSAGTTIGTSAMRSLPIGVPKIMVSTLASGQVRPWVGDKDIMMLNSVVDIAGVNRISRKILRQAAGAALGAVQANKAAREDATDRPLIAASMFGVTTPSVQQARAILEKAGYEVLVFHATGNGGQAMESLVTEGVLAGVLDITTTELADELVGGVLSAGANRLSAAGKAGLPQVISVGATDMVNFGPPDSIPNRFSDRTFYQHNPTVTLMRTTAEECRRLGREIADKAKVAVGPTAILLPLHGVSAIDREGQPFDDPEARLAMFQAIRQHRGDVEVVELDCHINDPPFAEAAARKLLDLISAKANQANQDTD